LVSLKNTTKNKFYNSLKADLVVFCKNNPAINKGSLSCRPVAFERYCRYLSYKVGFAQKGWIDLLLWNF
jgi:hypothetical protein